MSHFVSVNGEDSTVDMHEITVEVEQSLPCMPNPLDVDINNAQVVLIQQEDANNLIVNTQTLSPINVVSLTTAVERLQDTFDQGL